MFFSKNIIFLLFFQVPLIILGQDDTAEGKLKTQTITKTKDNGFKIDTEENSPTSEETEYEDDSEEDSKHSEGIY